MEQGVVTLSRTVCLANGCAMDGTPWTCKRSRIAKLSKRPSTDSPGANRVARSAPAGCGPGMARNNVQGCIDSESWKV